MVWYIYNSERVKTGRERKGEYNYYTGMMGRNGENVRRGKILWKMDSKRKEGEEE